MRRLPAVCRALERRDRHRRRPLAAADEAHPLAGRRLHVDAPAGARARRRARRGSRPGRARASAARARRWRRRCRSRSRARRGRRPTVRSSSSESAPAKRGSVSGKCWPMSPSPAAPSSASITACVSTSASEWPARPPRAGCRRRRGSAAGRARTRACRCRGPCGPSADRLHPALAPLEHAELVDARGLERGERVVVAVADCSARGRRSTARSAGRRRPPSRSIAGAG